MLAALADVTQDFAEAVEIAARILDISGMVLPATSEIVTLVAEFADGRVLQRRNDDREGRRHDRAARAAAGAAALLDEGQRRAAARRRDRRRVRAACIPASCRRCWCPISPTPSCRSRAVRILVANLMTEAGETDDFGVLEHLLTIERHLGRQLFDCVIYNTTPVPEALAAAYATHRSAPIVTGTFELNALERFGVRAIGVPLVSEHPAGKIRHHPERLASAITALAQGKLGAWRRARRGRRHLRCTSGSIQLRERPFALSPDPEYLYPSRVHQEALDYLRYGVESQAGFIVITGEIGSGKTTLLQTLLRNLDNQTTVGRIVNTMLEPRELLETIMIDFGLDPGGPEQAAAAARPVAVPGRSAARGPARAARDRRGAEPRPRGARRAADAVEPRDREVEAAADRPGRSAEPARQARGAGARAAAPAHHRQLSPAAARRGRDRALHQPPAAARGARRADGSSRATSTDLIHARSRGVPRIINVICDAALVFGYAEERRVFDEPMIADVLAELETTGVLPATSQRRRSRQADAEARGLGRCGRRRRSPSRCPRRRGRGAGTGRRGGARDRRSISASRRSGSGRLEIAEQRRVLAEEYRLLRASRESRPAADARPRPEPGGPLLGQPVQRRCARAGRHRRAIRCSAR